MKKYSLIFALASLCALFSSCDKEDKEDKIGVIGTWDLEKVVTEYVEDYTTYTQDEAGNKITITHKKGEVVEETPVEHGSAFTLTFRSDDLCIFVFTDYDNGEVDDIYHHVGPYAYDASTQTLKLYSAIEGNLTRLTETELQITHEVSDNNKIVYIENLQFKRIK